MKTLFTLFLAALFTVSAFAADISQTAASVQFSNSAVYRDGKAGATITAGQPLYKDANDSGKLKPADCDDASKYVVVGIAAQGAASGQPIRYCVSDPLLTLGGTVAAGAVVMLSATAGGICLAADMVSGRYAVFLGVGLGSNAINFRPVVGSVVP